jgi:hypothetical protein
MINLIETLARPSGHSASDSLRADKCHSAWGPSADRHSKYLIDLMMTTVSSITYGRCSVPTETLWLMASITVKSARMGEFLALWAFWAHLHPATVLSDTDRQIVDNARQAAAPDEGSSSCIATPR